ncbi:MAG: hypothetical protein L0Z53_10550 [Acidobacteriales bacterium]|nr:hypothetical protein [Terriglobales bacterium]
MRLEPFLVTNGLAFLVVCGELIRTFGFTFLYTLRFGWTYVLFVINFLFASATYALARYAFTLESDWLLAILVGALYPMLLRSRFTFFRSVGKKDDPQVAMLAMRMDEFYSLLQEKCFQQVDNHVALKRALGARALAEKYSEAELSKALHDLIAAKQVAPDKAVQEKYLQEILKESTESKRRYRLAMFLIDLAGDSAGSLLHN